MRLPAAGITLLLVACGGQSRPNQALAPADTARLVRAEIRAVSMGQTVRPVVSDSAVHAFVPLVEPMDVGGECRVLRPTSRVTVVTASFPRADSAHTSVSLTFDSLGNLVRYVDRRGLVPRLSFDSTVTAAQRDSTMRAVFASVNQTMIQLDFPVDHALATNTAAGSRAVAAAGTVAQMLNLERLGPPIKRIGRVRRLCGV